MNKQECIEAHETLCNQLVRTDYVECNPTYTYQECENELGIFYQLIIEHFEPKKNTSEFNNFKLHSDNTLKKLTKIDLIDYIHVLHRNWSVCDEQLKNCIDENMKITQIKPYKFEDLHAGMWVWDDKEKMCCQIESVLSFGKLSVNYHYDSIVEFEENRFFPIAKANEAKE